MSTIGVGPALVDTSTVSLSTQSWRPPQWSSPVYLILVPTTSASYVLTPLRVTHEQAIHHTEHPVQTGANITDHAFALAAKVTMEIGVSDVMDIPFPGMWGGSGGSTSVNAFNALRTLARSRTMVSLVTRLYSYTNMLVDLVGAEETNKTVTSGAFRVIFTELFIANAQVIATPARPDVLSSDAISGILTPAVPTSQVVQQFVSFLKSLPPTTAIGAGTATSVANCHMSVGQIAAANRGTP